MTEPFWKQLVHQAVLDAQYSALVETDNFDRHKTAIHLARFAEARMYERARVEIDARDKQIADLQETLRHAATQTGFEGRGCPLCHWNNGVFLGYCSLHQRIEELEAAHAAAWEPLGDDTNAATDGELYVGQADAEFLYATDRKRRRLLRLLPGVRLFRKREEVA